MEWPLLFDVIDWNEVAPVKCRSETGRSMSKSTPVLPTGLISSNAVFAQSSNSSYMQKTFSQAARQSNTKYLPSPLKVQHPLKRVRFDLTDTDAEHPPTNAAFQDTKDDTQDQNEAPSSRNRGSVDQLQNQRALHKYFQTMYNMGRPPQNPYPENSRQTITVGKNS